MVDHPDFCSVRELDQAKATMPLQLLRDREEDDDDVSAEPREDNKASPLAPVMPVDEALARFDPMMQRRSFGSIRSGVTVAMVAVALGFACCESFMVYRLCVRAASKISHTHIAPLPRAVRRKYPANIHLQQVKPAVRNHDPDCEVTVPCAPDCRRHPERLCLPQGSRERPLHQPRKDRPTLSRLSRHLRLHSHDDHLILAA